MSRSSTVTARETPLSTVTSASAGGLVIHGESLTVETTERIQLVDLTDRVMAFGHRVPETWPHSPNPQPIVGGRRPCPAS